jgi:HEAT repeat protein
MPLFGPPNVEKLKVERDVKGLIKALRYVKDEKVRLAAAGALGDIGDARALDPLVAVLQDPDPLVRAVAASALGRIGDARALDPLVAVLQDPDPSVRQAAVHALGKMGDARAVKPLTKVLKDHSHEVQQSAVEALMKLGWQPADNTQGALVAVIEKHWNKVADFGEAAVEPLLTLLKDEIKKDTFYIIHAREREILDCLVKIGSAAMEPLLAALRDATSVTQKKCIIGVLGQIGDGRAVEPLVLALKDADSDVREEAAKILLAQFGDIRALEPLLAILALKYDSSPDSGLNALLLLDLTKVGDAVIGDLLIKDFTPLGSPTCSLEKRTMTTLPRLANRCCSMKKRHTVRRPSSVNPNILMGGERSAIITIPFVRPGVPPPSDCAPPISAWPQKGDCAPSPRTKKGARRSLHD